MEKSKFVEKLNDLFNNQIEKNKLKWTMEGKGALYECFKKSGFKVKDFEYQLEPYGSIDEIYSIYHLCISIELNGQIVELGSGEASFTDNDKSWYVESYLDFYDEFNGDYDVSGYLLFLKSDFEKEFSEWKVTEDILNEWLQDFLKEIQLSKIAYEYSSGKEKERMEKMEKELREFFGDKIKSISLGENEYNVVFSNGIKFNCKMGDVDKSIYF